MKTDPFAIKKYPKWHPYRLAFTLQARLIELEAKRNFTKYALPEKTLSVLPPVPEIDFTNTAVTPIQMQHILAALFETEHFTDTVVVEVGCYRGITTKAIAQSTTRKVVAVDPYIGYGGFEEDYRLFSENINNLSNVIHERKASGEAARTWQNNSVSFVFIDAVHDYVNTSFDIEAWARLLVKGGVIACHDTDQLCFAGTRKAVFEANSKYTLFAHTDNLTILIK
jgi:predicted O-methyltransferase YrrM